MTDHERDLWEIKQVCLRYCRGIDRLDLDLVRSCYHPDALDHHNGFSGPVDDFLTWADGYLRKLDGTMHVINNHLATVRGDLAAAETYVQSHHWGQPYDDPQLNWNGLTRYIDRFERRDGVWRIAERFTVRSTTTIVPASARGDRGWSGTDSDVTTLGPRRDRDDLTYLVAAQIGATDIGEA